MCDFSWWVAKEMQKERLRFFDTHRNNIPDNKTTKTERRGGLSISQGTSDKLDRVEVDMVRQMEPSGSMAIPTILNAIFTRYKLPTQNDVDA